VLSAENIVQSLLDGEAADFVKTLPPSTWASFHIIRSGEHSIYAHDEWERGHGNMRIVYKNEHDGTRDFIGYIDEIQGRKPLWYVLAVAMKYPGKPTQCVGADQDWVRYPTMNEAAKALYDLYCQKNKVVSR
jgi:hypothetical protein